MVGLSWDLLLSSLPFSSLRTLHLSPKDIPGGRRRFLLLPQAEVRIQSPLSCGKVESVSPGLGANSPSPCKDLRQGWCSACDSSTQHSVPFSHTGPQTLLLVLLSYHMAACLGSTHDTHPTFRPQRVLSVMFCSAMEFWSGRFCSSWEAILGGECSIVPCDPPCTTCQAQ